MIDEKVYTVVGINGFRRGCLGRDEALGLAARMRETMRRHGWAGKVRVFFRDGSLVDG